MIIQDYVGFLFDEWKFWGGKIVQRFLQNDRKTIQTKFSILHSDNESKYFIEYLGNFLKEKRDLTSIYMSWHSSAKWNC